MILKQIEQVGPTHVYHTNSVLAVIIEYILYSLVLLRINCMYIVKNKEIFVIKYYNIIYYLCHKINDNYLLLIALFIELD